MKSYSVSHLPPGVVLRNLKGLVERDRATTAEMLAYIAEVHEQKLYAPEGYDSTHAYCVGELRMSEDMASKRLRAARAAREFPEILPALADGRLHLSGVVLLAPHLNRGNAADLLSAAANRTKADIEMQIAERFPRPDESAQLDALGAESTDVASAPGRIEDAAGGATITAVSAGRFELRLGVGQAVVDSFRYVKALLSHAIPSEDDEEVLTRALDALIRETEKRRFGVGSRSPRRTKRGATNPRTIPAHVRREVWLRDGGRCTFTSESGHRCEATHRLEFDHIVSFARGGESTAKNLRLRCHAHNQLEAERTFGEGFMREKRGAARAKAKLANARAGQRPAGRETAARPAHAPTQISGASAAAPAPPASSPSPPSTAQAPAVPAPAAQATAADPDLDVTPWLRRLGFSAAEARRAAALCEQLPNPSLEARVRFALSSLAPGNTRRVAPILEGFAAGTSAAAAP